LLAKLDAQDLDAASLQYIVIRMLCYRFRIHINNKNKVAVCSVHPLKLATVQCLACVKIKLAAAKSFHCSPKCFLDAWQHHHSMHTLFPANANCENGLQEGDFSYNHGAVNLKLNPRGAGVEDGPALVFSSSRSSISTLSKPAQLSSSRHQEDGGGTWQEVGQGKTYTPTADDIGHVLKLECTVVNASNGLGVTWPVLCSHLRSSLPHLQHLTACFLSTLQMGCQQLKNWRDDQLHQGHLQCCHTMC
jgi:hypothetical protein